MDFKEFHDKTLPEIQGMRDFLKKLEGLTLDEQSERLTACVSLIARVEELESIALKFKHLKYQAIENPGLPVALPVTRKEYFMKISTEKFLHDYISRYGRSLDSMISGLQSILKYAKANLAV